MSDTEDLNKDDPLSKRIKQKLKALTGGLSLRVADISAHLPRHPTKEYKLRDLSKVNRIVVHTTDRDWSITQLAEYDVGPNHLSSSGAPAITYHDVIMKQGTVFHTLPYEEISWHAGGYNKKSIGVAIMFIATDPVSKRGILVPTDKALKATGCHCGKLCLKFGLSPKRIFGHRELKGTGWFFFKGHKRFRKSCPGLSVSMNSIRKSAAEYMQIFLRLCGLYYGEIDGNFGKLSMAALKAYHDKLSS